MLMVCELFHSLLLVRSGQYASCAQHIHKRNSVNNKKEQYDKSYLSVY